MGFGVEKVLVPILGRPLLAWTLDAFERSRDVDSVLLVVPPDAVARYQHEVLRELRSRKLRAVIGGGATRHGSERAAVGHLMPAIEAGEIDLVLIHDAARPLVRPELIAEVVAAARIAGAAVPAVPADGETAVVRAVPDATIEAPFPGGRVWFAQTPQAFGASTLAESFALAGEAGFEVTDTAACVERAGRPVRLVVGSRENVKVTV